TYTVNAWFIQNLDIYKYETGTGCQQLSLPESYDKDFTFDEIPKTLKFFVNEITQYLGVVNLTIEIFLPLELLNYAVDCWELEDDLDMGFPSVIGHDYKVVVRSCERLTETYERYRGFWTQKWQTLNRFAHSSASSASAFMSIDDETVKDLFPRLKCSEIFGLRARRAPEKIGKGSIFAAILATAIPVALWLRQNLPDLDCQAEIEQILDGCILKLPESIKKTRCQVTSNTDAHIGHHLSLLWEDPYRLPPSISYSMK
ncbi:MAG: hypothetical protein SAK29_17875, partial [Scytonema sp. PMC 1069.18]|nr:hypothetical protein [Scytonema sp. PMC 1069.18]